MAKAFLVCILASSYLFQNCVFSQSCQGQINFEKIVHATTRPGTPSKFLFRSDGTSQQPITKDCLVLCRQAPDCLAFTLNYTSLSCNSLSSESIAEGALSEALLPTKDSSGSVLRKICLPAGSSACQDVPWAFERLLGFSLAIVEDKRLTEVASASECESACVSETSFQCRSANYDATNQRCHLSQEDRHTMANGLREENGKEYLENQCVDVAATNCRYEEVHNATVSVVDAITTATSQQDCARTCDQNIRSLCRSYSYEDATDVCLLSSYDGLALNTNTTFKLKSIYGERRCSADECLEGSWTFERVNGQLLKTVALQLPSPANLSSNLTSTCMAACAPGSDCAGIIIDYTHFACQILDPRAILAASSFRSSPGDAHFERVCLKGIPDICAKSPWLVERVPNAEMRDSDDKALTGVGTRADCFSSCLREKSFTCRSAVYDSRQALCRLYRNDRRTQPQAFVASAPGVDYLENQCLPPEQQCVYGRELDALPTYIDSILTEVASEQECQRACADADGFICRTAGFRPMSRDCLLSSVDEISGGERAIQRRPEAILLQRHCDYILSAPPPDDEPVAIVEATITSAPTIRPPSSGIKPPWLSFTGRCASGQTGQGFEKTAGHTLLAPSRAVTTVSPSDAGGVTNACQRQCGRDPKCVAFSVDYAAFQCLTYTAAPPTLISSPSKSFFRALCFRAARPCRKLWTFERVPNHGMQSTPREVISGVSKVFCQERCLSETTFTCRSATYDHLQAECRLHAEDRFMQPQAFVAMDTVDYLSNECADSPFPSFTLGLVPRQATIQSESSNPACHFLRRQKGERMLLVEESLSMADAQECELACSGHSSFTCRAFIFLRQSGRCLMSSSVAELVGSNGQEQDAIYAEKVCSEWPLSNSEAKLPFASATVFTSPTPEPCTAYDFSLERTAGVLPIGSDKSSLLQGNSTKQCAQNCLSQKDSCMGFTLLLGSSCQAYTEISSRSSLQESAGAIYFEKVCLRAAGCGKLWTFERVVGHTLSGRIRRTLEGVSSRQACQEQCLQESTFVCRSGVFVYSTNECRLSTDTRHTWPNDFRYEGLDVDYFENQCAPGVV